MLALLLVLQTSVDPAPVYRGSARELDVAIPRIETSVQVDGELDEPVWRQAARLTGFSQYIPADGRPAEDSTEVLVWYAPDAIHFGIRAFEAHGAVVRATLADRDNIDRDDQIQLLLDTYADHRRALLFAVNPLGVQQDGVSQMFVQIDSTAYVEPTYLNNVASRKLYAYDYQPGFPIALNDRTTHSVTLS